MASPPITNHNLDSSLTVLIHKTLWVVILDGGGVGQRTVSLISEAKGYEMNQVGNELHNPLHIQMKTITFI